MPDIRAAFAVIGLCLALPALAHGQSAPAFGQGSLDVVSEWRGEDRGDGSGSYTLVTSLTDASNDVVIRHELASERRVDGGIESNESLIVLEGGQERYRAESDPTELGPYVTPATAWVIPFDLEFKPDSRSNYRPQQKRIAEVAHSVVPDAKVSTKSASDGRTIATIEIPDSQPVEALAQRFVAIRTALREADLGLAKLVIRGSATAPARTAVAPAGGETP